MCIIDAARSRLLERREYVLLAALLAAMWPVWRWLAFRIASDPSEGWGLLSLATAITVTFVFGEKRSVRWGLPVLLTLVYIASYVFVPPLVRAMIAMSAIAALCSEIWFGKRMELKLWGLLLLCLPLIPTLNFYLGYPLRVVVGEMTSTLLHLNGFATTRDGATLLWGGQRISIDAPCSGIKMLWTGAYLTCALSGLQRLSTVRTLLLGVLAFALVMLANVLRAAALFYVEAGIVPEAKPAHELIGVVVFAAAALAVAAVSTKLRALQHAS